MKYDVSRTRGPRRWTRGGPTGSAYTVPAGTADRFAQALDQYRGTSVRVAALSGNQIMVYGTPADQLEVVEYINNETEQSNEFKAITITAWT